MRKPITSALLSGGAVALALVTAGSAIAAVEEAGDALPSSAEGGVPTGDQLDDQLRALQRDLGLSGADAAALFVRQERARELAARLREETGEAFGGAHYDLHGGTLTVSVTDEDALPQVTGAEVEARTVTYGEERLNGFGDALDAAADSWGEGVTGWYTSLARDAVVVTVLEGMAADAERLVAEAGVDSGAVLVEESDEQRPHTYADVLGGDPYYTRAPGALATCSVGFAVRGGFITAGHCGAAGTAAYADRRLSLRYGQVEEAVFPGSDMAKVRITGPWRLRPLVNDHAGGAARVAGHEEALEGESVCRSGPSTGWRCGTIESRNRTVRYTQGVVSGLVQTTACAETGDSGGPWMVGDQAQGITSGGVGDCGADGPTFYQPIRPILERWNLTLLTG